jgi:uncharacterized membrane protein YczE
MADESDNGDIDEIDIILADMLPYVGKQRVSVALEKLYGIGNLLTILFGVFVGGFVTSMLTWLTPNPLVMVGGWVVLLIGLTLVAIYNQEKL